MISNEYKLYLKNIKREKILVYIVQILVLVIFIFTWEILSRNNIINSFIYSSPSKIINTLIDLYKQNNLFNNIWITIYETIISFSLATLLGTIIAIILWYSNFLYKVIDPYLTVLNSLPKVALGPIIIIWAGANIKSVIIMALLMEIIITIITVYNGFKSTDKNKINLLRSMGANRYQMLKYLVLPNSYPTIISSLKINISMSLIGVIMGEFLV